MNVFKLDDSTNDEMLHEFGYTNSDGNFLYHRDDDEPAVVYKDGDMFWMQHGQFHRDNGPAVIFHSGTKKWYVKGRYHRDDGPAIQYENGNEEYFYNGKRITATSVEDFIKQIAYLNF
jgi:hypothetical protein